MKYLALVVLASVSLSGCGGSGDTASQAKGDTSNILKAPVPEAQRVELRKDQPTKPVTQLINNGMNDKYTKAPEMDINVKKAYTAVLSTSAGDITVNLHAKEVSKTVNNFVFLAKEHFYDNTIFHRTIKGFMIQGGDPTGTGMGGPGYKFDDEPFMGDYARGVLAMANSGPNTNGSQFFIMHANVSLPKNYVIFGEVTSGLETVDTIATAPTIPGGEGSKPVTPVVITSISVTEK